MYKTSIFVCDCHPTISCHGSFVVILKLEVIGVLKKGGEKLRKRKEVEKEEGKRVEIRKRERGWRRQN